MAPSSSQDVAVLLPVAISLVTTLTTILVHAIGFAAIARFVRREYRLGRAGAQFWRDVAIIAGVTLLAFVAHLSTLCEFFRRIPEMAEVGQVRDCVGVFG
jgi:hypothetical protein